MHRALSTILCALILAIKPTIEKKNNSNAITINPYNESRAREVNIEVGGHVKWITNVTCSHFCNIQWFHNDKNIQSKDESISKKYNTTAIFLHPANRTEPFYFEIAQLAINNISVSDSGTYRMTTTVDPNKFIEYSLTVKEANTSEENFNYYNERVSYLAGVVILFIILVVCITLLIKEKRKKKKLKKVLEEIGLSHFEEGDIARLNFNNDVHEQALLLPYDKKYEFPKEKLQFGKILGTGAFGVVREATAYDINGKNTKTEVAVKMIKRYMDPTCIKALSSELKIMIYLGQHLNVVSLLGACTKNLKNGEIAVILEYCKYGNLRDYLRRNRQNFVNQINENGEIDFSITAVNREFRKVSSKKSLSLKEAPIGSDGYLMNNDETIQENLSNKYADYRSLKEPIKTVDLISWSFQVACGMKYLTSREILHGDLAARNVLLADNGIVKICDFGLAKNTCENGKYQTTDSNMLPVKWMALESIKNRTFSTQSDIWSFGVTMWEFFSLSASPYSDINELIDLYEKLKWGYRLGKPKFATDLIYLMMKDCWHFCPELRPSFSILTERLVHLLGNDVLFNCSKLNQMYSEINANLDSEEIHSHILHHPTSRSSKKFSKTLILDEYSKIQNLEMNVGSVRGWI